MKICPRVAASQFKTNHVFTQQSPWFKGFVSTAYMQIANGAIIQFYTIVSRKGIKF